MFKATSFKSAAIAAQPVIVEAATTAGYIVYDAAVLLWDVATSDEAKALYVRVGKAIAHSAFYLLTLAIWGAIELLGLARRELPRFWQDARSAIRSAVASAQGEPVALPWSADGFSSEFLAQASEGLDIVWPSHTDRVLAEAGLG